MCVCLFADDDDNVDAKVELPATQVTTAPDNDPRRKDKAKHSISYAAERVIGNGSFGIVYQATAIETGETVAIKKVLQDRRFKVNVPVLFLVVVVSFSPVVVHSAR